MAAVMKAPNDAKRPVMMRMVSQAVRSLISARDQRSRLRRIAKTNNQKAPLKNQAWRWSLGKRVEKSLRDP